jgi:hypothetical protein
VSGQRQTDKATKAKRMTNSHIDDCGLEA